MDPYVLALNILFIGWFSKKGFKTVGSSFSSFLFYDLDVVPNSLPASKHH